VARDRRGIAAGGAGLEPTCIIPVANGMKGANMHPADLAHGSFRAALRVAVVVVVVEAFAP